MKGKLMIKIFSIIFSLFVSTAYANNIEFTVMHGAGGVSDLTTRVLAKHLGTDYQVVNRPGGAGRIAIRHLIKDETLMLATMSHVFVTNPLNYPDLDYDPYKDLEVIAVVGIMPSVLICHKQTGFKEFSDFEKNHKSLTFGVGGYGSSEHLSTEVLFKQVKENHKAVAFSKGGATSITSLLGGHIDCMFGNFPTIRSKITHENIVTLISSHPVNDVRLSWEDSYKSPFPLQSYLAVIVPKNMNEIKKYKILSDFKKIISDQNLKKELLELGLFPKLGIDNKSIKEALDNNEYTRSFILDNKIDLKGQ